MILLDTNVLSELMRPAPNPQIVNWLDTLNETEIWISAVTLSEIFMGIALLPDGKRKRKLLEAAQQMFQEDFEGHCLPFDCESASAYAGIISECKGKGRPISVEDAQIASIALTAELTLATRNVKDFSGIETLELFNPWTDINFH
ncbi:MAG: type II toxin-antitoxin system VapC family toxin [Desulfobacteraceae bacterium]|nr:type II toxin-antitoxin system VapC family toxin [Desulfobacteraceae bacterium]